MDGLSAKRPRGTMKYHEYVSRRKIRGIREIREMKGANFINNADFSVGDLFERKRKR